MRQILSPKLLPYVSATAGILSAGSLCLLHIAGEDDRGLFPSMHPGWVLACLIAAAGVALLAFLCRDLGGKFRYPRLFPSSGAAAAGILAAAAGFLINGIADIANHGDIYGTVCGAFCVFSAVLLVFLAHCRHRGKRPAYLIRGVVTLCLMLRLICCFRHWTDPQVETYLFPLLASIALMLASYHRTALEAGAGTRKAYAFFSQCAVIFCCGAVLSADWFFYLTVAVWMGLDTPVLRQITKQLPKE